MGRSRGGLTTKIHALVDAEGRPIRLKLTEGQTHDGRSAADMFETLSAGHILLADRAYDGDALRTEMASRAHGPTSAPCRTASKHFHSAPGSIGSATLSRGSSTNSNTSGPLPHDTASATKIFLPQSNSLQFASGCQLVSRSPRLRAHKIYMQISWRLFHVRTPHIIKLLNRS